MSSRWRADVRRALRVASVDTRYAWIEYEESPAADKELYVRQATFEDD